MTSNTSYILSELDIFDNSNENLFTFTTLSTKSIQRGVLRTKSSGDTAASHAAITSTLAAVSILPVKLSLRKTPSRISRSHSTTYDR